MHGSPCCALVIQYHHFTHCFSPGAGKLVSSVFRPGSCRILNTWPMGVPDKHSSGSSTRLLLHAFRSLAANNCFLEPNISSAGVSPDFRISAPHRVVGSAPRTDLACQLRVGWRSSRLPTSLGSHQSSLPDRPTGWTKGTWTALMLSDRTLYIIVRVRSLASAAHAFPRHWLWCIWNVRCASIQTPSQSVANLSNHMNPFATFTLAVTICQRCFLLSGLELNGAAPVCAVWNSTTRRFPHSMFFTGHLSSIVMTRLTSHSVVTQPGSSTVERPLADTYSSTH
jgi:hypothetical protein